MSWASRTVGADPGDRAAQTLVDPKDPKLVAGLRAGYVDTVGGAVAYGLLRSERGKGRRAGSRYFAA